MNAVTFVLAEVTMKHPTENLQLIGYDAIVAVESKSSTGVPVAEVLSYILIVPVVHPCTTIDPRRQGPIDAGYQPAVVIA